MAKKGEKRGLGRGLSALIADVKIDGLEGEKKQETDPQRADMMVPIERIVPNAAQPRRDFPEQDLKDLTASIAQKGIIQPIIVRVDPNNASGYQIVAGERRWRAAQLAQLHEVPVLVRDLDDVEVLELAIIENIQRSDLNAIEEALGYKQLMGKFGHTQEKMAEALGKSRSHIANLLRLLNLPQEVQQFLRDGLLSNGHARALITSDDPLALAKRVISADLSVRETERLAKAGQIAKPGKRRVAPEKDADTKALEGDLSANLKMKVSIDHKAGAETGKLTIDYKTFDQLDSLCQILSLTPRDVSK